MTATDAEMTPVQQLGNRLRIARGWCRASRREVAAQCGFSVSTLTRLENGRQWPKPIQMHLLSLALLASPEFLIFKIPPAAEDIAAMPLNWKLNQISKRQAKKALALLEGTLAALGRPVPGKRAVTPRRQVGA